MQFFLSLNILYIFKLRKLLDARDQNILRFLDTNAIFYILI
jgi:hypothetical protein